MKKSIKALILIFVLSILLIPSINSKAAVKPAQPTAGAYTQVGPKMQFYVTFDNNLMIQGDMSNGSYTHFGYEITIKTLKGKKITTVDKNTVNNGYDSDFTFSDDLSTVYISVSNKKLKSQGFKFSVKSYVYNADGSKLYSDATKEKIIIPRATMNSIITKYYSKKTAKIKWSKVSGAKSYSVYVSTDGKKFKKKTTTKKLNYTLTKLKLYKTYYIYITANGIKNGKKKLNSTKLKDSYSNSMYFTY